MRLENLSDGFWLKKAGQRFHFDAKGSTVENNVARGYGRNSRFRLVAFLGPHFLLNQAISAR